MQLARHFGAHVTAVCSSSKVEFVRALAPPGTLVLGGGEGGDRFFGGMGRTLRAALWSMVLKQRLAMLVGFVKPEPLQALADILGQPGVTPAVDRSFPLEETADATRSLVSGQVRGKLVIRVAA